MDFSPYLPLLSILLLMLALVGSITLSLTVWRRRRKALRGPRTPLQRLQGLLVPVGLGGVLLVLFSFALRGFFPRQGEILMRDTLVVRAEPARGQPHISSQPEIEAGQSIVRFARAGDEAEREALRHQIERVQAERAQLLVRPVDTAPGLVREEQNLRSEKRHLIQREAALRVESQRLAQQTRNEILEKKVQRGQIRTALGTFEARLKKTEAELAYAQLRQKTGKSMLSEEVISSLQQAEEQSRSEVLRAQRQQILDEKQGQTKLLRELDAGIAQLESSLEEQQGYVASSLASIQKQLEQLGKQQESWQLRSAADRQRQAELRNAELAALEMEKAEAQARLRSLEQRSAILAQQRGRILWQHPSPAGATTGHPILLFGADNSVRARFRLRASEAALLAEAGTIDLRADSEDILAPQLTGRYLSQKPIANEPGMALVELECQATQDQLRILARGEAIEARLRWSPPIWLDPLFLLGLLLFVTSMLPQLLPQERRAARPHRLESEGDANVAASVQTEVPAVAEAR
jgi:hypothetical protein